jgi:hypothetical protein
LLAKLVTNPRLVREAIGNTDEFITWLRIEKDQRQDVVEFFKKHGKRFLASSQLLIKKRLDDIVEAMQVGKKVFSYESLQRYFENYLEKTGLDEYVPKNPLAESILFCRYIISSENVCEREKIILDYDLTRNLVFQDLMNDVNNYNYVIHDVEAVGCISAYQLKAVAHPSIRIKSFPAGTSLIIQAIKNNAPNDSIKLLSESEILIFHKNWKKGGVATLKISSDTEKFIKILTGSASLGHAYYLLNKETGKDVEVLRPMVAQLIECGLCVFQSIGSDSHV